MDNRPIGIFDSGLGGLTLVAALRQLMPEENMIYLGDSARMPYGGRPRAELLTIARQDIDFMLRQGAKMIIAACGTISSNAPELLTGCSVPALGVLEPGAKALAAVKGSGPLGIAATPASIRSGAFRRELERLCPGREILDLPCPDFTPLIESGHVSAEDPLLRQAIEHSLAPARAAGAAALLLGCTHYGMIDQAISAYMGPDVSLVSASQESAKAACGLLRQLGMTGGEGNTLYYTSGSVESFERGAEALLGHSIEVRQAAPMPTEKGSGET